MFQTQLINTVLEWERRLEIENEKRKNHRFEPYVNFLAKVHPCRKERKSSFARIFRRSRVRQPVYDCYVQEYCQETQPG